MELFLDTANLEEIRQAVALGVVSGVTTNPSLAAKEGIGDLEAYKTAVLEMVRLVRGPISVEVTHSDAQGMVAQAREIASWHPQVVVKLPSTVAGFQAMAVVCREGIRVNQTLCFSVNQALLGARLGVAFISPFVGRLDDEGHTGMALVADIVQMVRRYGYPSKVLAASIRHPLHVVEALRAGADIATVPFKVLMQMTHHPLTDVGMQRFAQDWEKAGLSRAAR
ncbi:MAG: fructose-6-phosphate aldolase [Dehalococcoidia bacterium]|nr:fructose-6-phosphate aldolase [Dehalococcoidia bacterium]MDW8120217.1 fructose-6-phosphate aldolase [Chloroflexota bacterium]